MKTYPRVIKLLKEEADRQGGIQPASKKLGIDRTSYTHYFEGNREPTKRTLEKIAAYFRTSVAWLIGEENPVEKTGDPIFDSIVEEVKRVYFSTNSKSDHFRLGTGISEVLETFKRQNLRGKDEQ